jgi:hypothetical protein
MNLQNEVQTDYAIDAINMLSLILIDLFYFLKCKTKIK